MLVRTELVKTNHGAKLLGDLTVDQTPTVHRQSSDWRVSGMPASVDLSGLGRTDSSAVALLLEWQQWALEQGQSIRFDHPPEHLVTLAELSQAHALLGWECSA